MTHDISPIKEYPQFWIIRIAVVYFALIAQKNNNPSSWIRCIGILAIDSSSNCWYLIATYVLEFNYYYTPRQGSALDNCHGGSIMTTSNKRPVSSLWTQPNRYFWHIYSIPTHQSNVRMSVLIPIELIGTSKSSNRREICIPKNNQSI